MNEGQLDEWVAAGNSRDEVEEIIVRVNKSNSVRTKRFFKIKEDNKP